MRCVIAVAMLMLENDLKRIVLPFIEKCALQSIFQLVCRTALTVTDSRAMKKKTKNKKQKKKQKKTEPLTAYSHVPVAKN